MGPGAPNEKGAAGAATPAGGSVSTGRARRTCGTGRAGGTAVGLGAPNTKGAAGAATRAGGLGGTGGTAQGLGAPKENFFFRTVGAAPRVRREGPRAGHSSSEREGGREQR